MLKKVLVTGGNGFLALHLIKQLLNNDYQVRTTVRSLAKKEQVLATLKKNQTPHLDQLTFVEATLTTATGWTEAMADINYVLSVAAPVFVGPSKVAASTDQVATAGIRRIIQTAEKAGVKRIVMTANLGAVGFSNKDPYHITTEADWTNANEPGLSRYEKSKLLAEKSAWQYLEQTHSPLEFVTINAGAMLGPALDEHLSGSFGLLKNLLNPTTRVPNIALNIVDVRTVAQLHLRAMTSPVAANQRFLAVNDQPISMPEIVALIKATRPELAPQLPMRSLPNWLIRLAAIFNQQAKEGRLLLALNHQVSNQKAKRLLNWQPNDNKTTILSALDTMQQNGQRQS
ncbi:NAD-dependent epimerase/dehydratase family protein [Loigolactobacillus jiayinensis]|uniref:NAD-dependent epimerase/dehydratase family protein n=1 Tax=Loigolactobacillus jiayinensis TaxID=2486016 RepID=A0ABW1RI04_9LACO|nr:NAD-dependent epimerase/dehydratase family protein [Loigolactobacillus jiayinensis]